MSSGHCAHCGAMSTIWLPTCVFCGQSLTDQGPGEAREARTRPVLQLALQDQPAVGAPAKVIKEDKAESRPCTSRLYQKKPRAGLLETIRSFFARLLPRPTVIRR